MRINVGIIFFSFLVFMQSCITPPDFPIEPVITYQGINKFSINQGNSTQDSFRLFFSFTDGDGDLGVPSNEFGQETFDIFVTDLRTGLLQDKLFLPHVPPKGASNGIQGTAEMVVFTTCCLFEDGRPPCEEDASITNDLQYEIYIKDRAGNESNRIQTEIITLECR